MFFSVRVCQVGSAGIQPWKKFCRVVLRIHFLIVRLGCRSGLFSSFRPPRTPKFHLAFFPLRLGLDQWCFFVALSGSQFPMFPGLPLAPSLGASNIISITSSTSSSRSSSRFLCFLPRLAFAFKLPSLPL